MEKTFVSWLNPEYWHIENTRSTNMPRNTTNREYPFAVGRGIKNRMKGQRTEMPRGMAVHTALEIMTNASCGD